MAAAQEEACGSGKSVGGRRRRGLEPRVAAAPSRAKDLRVQRSRVAVRSPHAGAPPLALANFTSPDRRSLLRANKRWPTHLIHTASSRPPIERPVLFPTPTMASVAATSTTHTPGAAYSAEEVAFFAGDQQITIQARAPIPASRCSTATSRRSRRCGRRRCPCGSPSSSSGAASAASWRRLARAEQLEETLAEERRNHERFAPLPYHYLEVAFELLSVAEDDLQEANRIRVALVDIEDTRRAKLARGLKTIDHNTDVITLPDISAMELNRIRGVATGALNSLRLLNPGANGAANGGGGPGGGGGGGGYGGGQGGGSFPGGDGGSGGGNARLQAALKRQRRS